MIARDTIEEKVAALARRKAALCSGVMDDGDVFATRLTAEDIRGLVDVGPAGLAQGGRLDWTALSAGRLASAALGDGVAPADQPVPRSARRACMNSSAL